MTTPSNISTTVTREQLSTTTKDDKDKDKNKARLQWNDQTEQLLSSWSDIAICYNWMHDKSFRMFQQRNFSFSLPVIILSTLTGTLNLALQGYVPAEYMTYAQAFIGGVNIFTGILTTLQNYFRYAENSESHRNSSIGWSKLQRNISVELTFDRNSRKEADSFMKVCRMEYDRLLEHSPVIPARALVQFKNHMKKSKNERIIQDEGDIILPDVCGNLRHTIIYKPSSEQTVEDEFCLNQPLILPEINSALFNRIDIIENKLKINDTSRPYNYNKPMVVTGTEYQYPFKKDPKSFEKDPRSFEKNISEHVQSDLVKNLINKFSNTGMTGSNNPISNEIVKILKDEEKKPLENIIEEQLDVKISKDEEKKQLIIDTTDNDTKIPPSSVVKVEIKKSVPIQISSSKKDTPNITNFFKVSTKTGNDLNDL